MAQIREYNRQVEAVSPVQGREVSAASLGGGGQALEFAGKALTHVTDFVEKVQEQDDAIKINKNTSELYLRQSQKLQDLKVSGKITEPESFQKYKEEFDNDFAKIGEDLKTAAGRKLLAEKQSTYTTHFGGAFIKDSADAKGVQAKSGMTLALNNFSSGLFTNPSDINHAMSEWENSVQAVQKTGMVSPEEADKIKIHGQSILADSAVRGLIDKDPNTAKAILGTDIFDKYMDGNRKSELMRSAEVGIRGLDADKKRAEVDIKSKQEKAAEAEINVFLPKIYNNELTSKEVLRSSNLNPVQKEHYVNLINKQANGTARNNPTVANEIYRDIQAGIITSTDEITAKVGEGIDINNATKLAKILADRKDPITGIRDSDAKRMIHKEAEKALMKNPILGPDPEGQNRLNKFTYDMELAIKEGQQQGKTVSQLTSPTSPDYVGTALINKYRATTKEIMDANMRGLKDNKAKGYTGIVVPKTEDVQAEIARRAALKTPAPVVK